jgi:hypothetical protein
MKCPECLEWLYDFQAGKLEEKTRNLLQEHLSRCAKCQRELKDLKATLGILSQEKQIKPGEEFWVNFLPEVRKKLEKREKKRFAFDFKPRFLFASLSLALILIVATVLIWKQKPTPLTEFSGTDEEVLAYSPTSHSYELAEILTDSTAQEKLDNLLSDEEKSNLLSAEDKFYQNKSADELLQDLDYEQLKIVEEKLKTMKI